MNDEKIRQAASALLAARKSGTALAGLADVAPATEAETWAIQRAVLAGLGGSIGGYKCAAPPGMPTSAAIVAAAGIRRASGIFIAIARRRRLSGWRRHHGGRRLHQRSRRLRTRAVVAALAGGGAHLHGNGRHHGLCRAPRDGSNMK